MLKILFCVVEIPFAQDPVALETLLIQTIETQLGSHQLLRWAITALTNNNATIEAVVTLDNNSIDTQF